MAVVDAQQLPVTSVARQGQVCGIQKIRYPGYAGVPDLTIGCPRGEAEARKSRDSYLPQYSDLVTSAIPSDTPAIQATLSAPRVSTYLAAARGDVGRALALYGWNAQISAAMMLPAHFAEVATRNAVSDVLTTLYGANWPWDLTFRTSLPSPSTGFNPRRELVRQATREPTTGKVIAELKFAFWEKMFTARHDVRIWGPHIHSLFPNSATILGAHQLRDQICGDLGTIRQLRNRIAHHEPIFTRDLNRDLTKMLELIEWRSLATSEWVRSLEEASAVIASRP